MRRNFFYLLLAVPVLCRAQQMQNQPGSTIGVTYFRQIAVGKSTVEDGIGLQYARDRQANATFAAALNAFFTKSNPGTGPESGTAVLDAGFFYRHNFWKQDHKFKPFYYAGVAFACEASGLYARFPAGAGVTCRLKSIFIDAAIQYNTAFGKSVRNSLRIGVTISGILTRHSQKAEAIRPGFFDMLVGKEAKAQVAQVIAIPAPLVDRDGDGIVDSLDACPLVPGVRQFNGCPVPDADSTSVNDDNDSCKTVPGQPSNKGCPLPRVSLQSFLTEQARQIHFKIGSDALLPPTMPVLNAIVKLLLEHTEIRLAIYGHTDQSGKAGLNQALSEKRAKAVYLYLVANGIPAYRLRYQGFGARKPLVNNMGYRARAINRRVELIEETSK